tara:strand:+ start:880 stop:1182 length:303 start_codon:yes stop_codon:yes gene_type:complete
MLLLWKEEELKDEEDEDPSRNFLFVVSSIASNISNLPVKNKYPIDIISKENTNDNAEIVTRSGKCLSGTRRNARRNRMFMIHFFSRTQSDDDENGVRAAS